MPGADLSNYLLRPEAHWPTSSSVLVGEPEASPRNVLRAVSRKRGRAPVDEEGLSMFRLFEGAVVVAAMVTLQTTDCRKGTPKFGKTR